MPTFGEESTNQSGPKMKFVEFVAKQGVFATWNPSEKRRDEVKLGDLIVLQILYKITGYSEVRSSLIYSNTAETWEGPFTVKLAKDKTTFKEGSYNDIKADIKAIGGKLSFSVICMQSNGELINLIISGSGFKPFSEFLRYFNQNKNKMVLAGLSDAKKGDNKYKVPEWKAGAELTSQEILDATNAVVDLKKPVDGE